MVNLNNTVVSWVFIYWIISVNTLGALVVSLFLGEYSYSDIIPNSVLAIFCAFTQILTHLKNKQYSVPFYLQFTTMFLAVVLYFILYVSNDISAVFTFDGLAILSLVGFIFTLPLVLIAYFIKFRVLKYETEPNKSVK